MIANHMKRNPLLWQVFLTGLILRIIPVLLARGLGIGLDDMFQYDMLARSLASGNGYRWYTYEDLRMLQPYAHFDLSSIAYDPVRGIPSSFRAPLYPSFLAVVYFVVGGEAGRFFAARLAQAGLGALLAPLTMMVSRRLFPNAGKAAAVAAWIVACYPLLVIYPLGLATENLFFVLLLVAFLFLLRLADAPIPVGSQPTWISNLRTATAAPFAGMFLALSALTRSVILPFAGMSFLWVWFSLRQKRVAVLLAIAFLVFILPWMIRNTILHQELTGIETSMGYNLYLGYHPKSDGSFTYGVSLDLIPILDDAERDRTGARQALGFIREQPERVLSLAVKRLGHFFGLEKRVLMYFYSNDILGYLPAPLLLVVAAILLLPFTILAPSAALGLGLTRANPCTILLYLLLFAYLMPHVLILAEDRFHLALIPFLAILAAQAWSGGAQAVNARWRESNAAKFALILVTLGAALMTANWGLELVRDADKIKALLAPDGNYTWFPY